MLRIILPTIILLLAVEARAEAVRIMTGPNTFGAGWIFLDRVGCFVATAGHVIKGDDGHVRRALVRDGQGREWSTREPLVLSKDPDVAVLPVVGADDPSRCGVSGRSRLHVAGLAERARVLREGAIETAGRVEMIRVPVVPFGARMDANRGEVFSVRSALGDPVAKGWSGSPVTDANGLVGIVIEAEQGAELAVAVRADAIARLIEAARARQGAPASAAKGTAAFAVNVLAGETLDPARGPDTILRGAGPGWRVRPQRGAVTIALRAPAERPFERVALELDAASARRLVGYEIAVGLGGRVEEEFQPVSFCRPAGADGTVIACRFLQQLRRSLRLVITWRGDEPVTIMGVAVQ
jgi:hypothetical protein